jgi:tetratricopeptide (TPR) repeat protein
LNGRTGKTILILGLILAGVFFAACASPARKAVKVASTESSRALAAGDFEKALELQQTLYHKNPGDKKAVSSYIKTVEGVKQAADLFRRQGKYTQAARTYRVLLDAWADFSALAGALPFMKANLEDDLRNCRIALCEIRSGQELEAGNHEKAFALFEAALKDYPGDAAMRASYARAIDEVNRAGAKALAVGDYAPAGKIHALLLKNYASFEGHRLMVAVGKDYLAEVIQTCRTQLTNRGLAEYRNGHLEKAISIWESLLVFDTENNEIRKAVETAKAQLGKIKTR